MSPRRTRKAAPAAAEAAPISEHEFIMKMLRGAIEPIYPPRFDELGLAPTDAEADPSGLIESLCGADDSQNVEQYDGTLGVTQGFVASHQGAVGQLQWNNNLASIYTSPGDVNDARWCSGTMISSDLFLTAGHCFDQTPSGWTVPRANGTMNPIPSTEIATNMKVNFNYQFDPAGNLRAEQSFAVTQLVEYRLGGLDFAIVRLTGTPGLTWGVTEVAAGDAAVGDMLAIIGHPAGVPKRIEAGPLSDFVGNSIRYNDIDTLGGNSGSGILGPAGTIVGVHTNGGCTGAMTGHNFGQRISAVRNASPTIRNLEPTIKSILDRPDPKFKATDDVPTFKKLADDPPLKLKSADDLPTFKKLADDPPLKLKFADDLAFKQQTDDAAAKKLADDPDPGFKKLDDDAATRKKVADDPDPVFKKQNDDDPFKKTSDDFGLGPGRKKDLDDEPAVKKMDDDRPVVIPKDNAQEG